MFICFYIDFQFVALVKVIFSYWDPTASGVEIHKSGFHHFIVNLYLGLLLTRFGLDGYETIFHHMNIQAIHVYIHLDIYQHFKPFFPTIV